MKKAKSINMPPIAVWVAPTIFEKILLAFMVAHFFIRRSSPAIRSNTPLVKNTAPVKIKLVTIRNPPIARLNLTSFRIQFHSTIARDIHAKTDNIVLSQFNMFAPYMLDKKNSRA